MQRLNKLIFGVGLNDSINPTYTIVNGKIKHIPSYSRWHSMIRRCYSEHFHKSQPTYRGCTVCEEWQSFEGFKLWFNEHYIEGYHLDKDIKSKGNKVYSPDACLFVPADLNEMFKPKKAKANGLPCGVSLPKGRKLYRAQASVNGVCVTLGSFKTKKEAIQARNLAVNRQTIKKAAKYPQFAKYLINHLL